MSNVITIGTDGKTDIADGMSNVITVGTDEFRDCLLALRRRVEFLAACLEDLANEMRAAENRLGDVHASPVREESYDSEAR